MKYTIRHWTAKHAGFFSKLYLIFEKVLLALNPVLSLVGHQNLEKPFAASERVVKGFLFETQMCGTCILGGTGMVCPMNCPKQLRNGPCGGVRMDGNCEIKPEMKCVWVEIVEGAEKLDKTNELIRIQPAVSHNFRGTSSWLRELRLKSETISRNPPF